MRLKNDRAPLGLVLLAHAALAATTATAWAADGEPSPLAYVRPTDDPVPAATVRVKPISDELRTEYDIDPFYKKVAVINGLPIIGSDNVSDYAFLECAYVLDHMLAGCDKIKDALAKNKVRMGIIAATEYTMDIPENQNRWMIERAAFNDRRSRGLGGKTMATCGEENLLSLRGDPYRRENITIHEFAHTIASNLQDADPAWWDRLEALYKQAMDDKLWENTYAATNVQEYWAEGVQSWFDCNTPTDDGSVHNGIWNRERLKEYDPRLAAFLAETFGDGAWRYVKTTDRAPGELAHLAGLDREQMPEFDFAKSPRIQAEEAAGGGERRRERNSERRRRSRETDEQRQPQESEN